MPKFTAPHWLTATAGVLALVAGALATQNTFPSLTPVFQAVAALAVVFAVPTITGKTS